MILKWKWRSAGPFSCHYTRMGYFEATVVLEQDTKRWEWEVKQRLWPDVEPNDWDDEAFSKDPLPYAKGYRSSEARAKWAAEQALRDAHNLEAPNPARYAEGESWPQYPEVPDFEA